MSEAARCRVIASNVSSNISLKAAKALFSEVGKVKKTSFRVSDDDSDGDFQSLCVEYATEDLADAAVRLINGKIVDGYAIHVVREVDGEPVDEEVDAAAVEDHNDWTPFILASSGEKARYRMEPNGCSDGGFSDVYKGEAQLQNGETHRVAIKVLRGVNVEGGPAAIKGKLEERLHRETYHWAKLSHHNVIPLLGYTLANNVAMISPWFAHGTIQKYLTSTPNCNRWQLLHDVASGLAYLHEKNIIHGDVKPDNVLVSDQSRAVIIDFGFAKTVEEDTAQSLANCGNCRWMAPELIDSDEETPSRTFHSDVYSFGSVAFLVVTGELPYHGIPDLKIWSAIMQHQRPPADLESSRPHIDVSHPFREMLRRCWERNPLMRPTMSDLREEIGNWCPTPTSTNENNSMPDHSRHIPANGSEAAEKMEFTLAELSFTDLGVERGLAKQLPLSRTRRISTTAAADLFQVDVDTPDRGKLKVAVKLYRHVSSMGTGLNVTRELEALQALSHPSLNNVLTWHQAPDVMWLVSPWMQRGNLGQCLQRDPDRERRRGWVIDVTSGLDYLHRHSICHGDIQPNNVLISDSEHALLTDFGLSKVVAESDYPKAYKSQIDVETIRWCAPELLSYGDATPSTVSDVYSLGSLLCQIVTGEEPYEEIKTFKPLLSAILIEKQKPFARHYAQRKRVPTMLAALGTCWAPPEKRTTSEALLLKLLDVVRQQRNTGASILDVEDDATMEPDEDGDNASTTVREDSLPVEP